MVVTMLVTGIPRHVSLTVLSYNLDSILSTDEVGKFRLREYTDVSDRHREVFVDFNSGFDAMCAQELLHDFELILENGSHNRLKAKIIGSSPSKLPSLSPSRKGRSKSRDTYSLMPYGSTDSIALDFDSRLQMIEKYKEVVKAETELVALKRKLRKEKRKFSQLKDSSDTSESDSSSGSKMRKRKKKSKKRSKSKRNKFRKKSCRSPSATTVTPNVEESCHSDSDNEPSCSFTRKSTSPDNMARNRSPARPVRSHSKHSTSPSAIAPTPSPSISRPSSPKSSGQKNRFLKANAQSSGSRRSSSVTAREHSGSRVETIRSPLSRRSRSKTRKLKSRSRSPKLYRRTDSSLSGTRGGTERSYSKSRSNSRDRKSYSRKDSKRYSQSRSYSRTRKLTSPYKSRKSRRSSDFSPPNERYERKYGRDFYRKSQEYKSKTKRHPEIINVVRTNKNRIIELDSDDEPTKKSPKAYLKERPRITDADRILILNKLEEASKSIVNEINIAISFKHVAQLKVLNLTEKEQAITVIKKYVDNYLRDLIPESMALAMTVVGIVRNFRMSFSKDEENRLVEGIINNIIRDREQLDCVQVKTENSPLRASDWREVDDLLRDIENDDLTEKPNYSGIEVVERPEKRISTNPHFFLPIKKIIKQMKSHILPLNFNEDEDLEKKFIDKLRKVIRQRISKLLIGRDFVSTQQIIEIYREKYSLDGDLMLVNEVFIPIINGTDTSDNETSNVTAKNDNYEKNTDNIKNIVNPGNKTDNIKNTVNPGNKTDNIKNTVNPGNKTDNIKNIVNPGNVNTSNTNNMGNTGNQNAGNMNNDENSKVISKNNVSGISKNGANIVSENNKEGNEKEDWQSVKIKEEAISTCNDESPNNTTPSRLETNTEDGQCIKLVITAIIKKEEDE